MAHRVKCPECNGCMGAVWFMPNRYYYCGFCRTYYGGRKGELVLVEAPYNKEVEEGKIEDPILEENNG